MNTDFATDTRRSTHMQIIAQSSSSPMTSYRTVPFPQAESTHDTVSLSHFQRLSVTASYSLSRTAVLFALIQEQ